MKNEKKLRIVKFVFVVLLHTRVGVHICVKRQYCRLTLFTSWAFKFTTIYAYDQKLVSSATVLEF